MKILLLGELSNYHACLAVGLRRLGHTVTVASDGGAYMRTAADLSLKRRLPGKAGGALLYARLSLTRCLEGYDIVSMAEPSFVKLRPSRLRPLFRRLLDNNGRVFLTAAAEQKAFMQYLSAPDCDLRYSEYFCNGTFYEPNRRWYDRNMEWCKGEISDFCDEVYDSVHGVTTALYEYHRAMQRRIEPSRLAYVGIPVDLRAVQPINRPLCADGRLNILLGAKLELRRLKGTDRLLRAAMQVQSDLPSLCRVTEVYNQPYKRYLELMRSGDLLLDQLYSYTPATNALLGMAAGQAVVSGGEQDYYDFIGERSLRPVINAVPDTDQGIYDLLRRCVEHPDTVAAAAAAGREFVARHNDTDVVAQRCIDFWTR